jgi:hypothetical protein
MIDVSGIPIVPRMPKHVGCGCKRRDKYRNRIHDCGGFRGRHWVYDRYGNFLRVD